MTSLVDTEFPPDYAERVYAGVLGKIIGVYLGRPFEGWRHAQILEQLGEVGYYVNDRTDVALKNHRLIVTDDDITGTFTFARAMRDYPASKVDAAQVARTWLNYIIEERTVLWWGGRGNSTEHTAFLLMQDGVLPPHSGSIESNGKVVAEQVGAQIFVEAWAMACPGEPDRAAFLAEQAASVSHDGEALFAARVVAALVAQAFVESDVDALLDTAVSLIPRDCLIRRVIDDVREWHAGGDDWRQARERIDERYGYERYGGNCHVVPNHAAVVNAVLHGGGDFTRSLGIIASTGWDTDSNGGNVGCIAGVMGGLPGIEAGPDWRGPVADRMYLPTADGGGCITDAAREALTVVGYAHALRETPPPVVKDGARFHFEFAGSLQGFAAERPAALELANVAGHSATGSRSLAVHYPGGVVRGLVMTPTFITPQTIAIPPYGMTASPTLYPGQVVRARVVAEGGPVTCQLALHRYDGNDERRLMLGSEHHLRVGEATELLWQVPGLGGHPVADVGLAITSSGTGTIYVDYVTWDGEPNVTFSRPLDGGRMWRHAWVDAVDKFDPRWPEPFRLVQNRGKGMLIQGTREWRDYEVTADVTPHLARAVGLAARVQGLGRFYALRLADRGVAQLVKALDGEVVLAEQPFAWEYGKTYELRVGVKGDRVEASVGDVLLGATDPATDLAGGGIGLLIDEGRTASQQVRVRPITS